MEKDIEKVMRQFDFEPEIVNAARLENPGKYAVGGMGGSHLPADFVKSEDPSLDMIVHSDYGLPPLPKGDGKRLFIAISHSGTTEETVDFAEQAFRAGLPVAVISSGGELIEFAKKNGLPHIVIPLEGLEPRMATMYMAIALLAVIGQNKKIKTLKAATKTIDMDATKNAGKDAAEFLAAGVPLVYASRTNEAPARFWKILMNETGKRAAFTDVFPELNHNEMMSFVKYAQDLRVVYLTDLTDHPRIQKRMRVMRGLVEEKGGAVKEVALLGANRFEKLIFAMLAAYWMADTLAVEGHVDPNDIGLIEEFKRRILT